MSIVKITIIHSIYKPDTRGGAETVVENIVSGLKNKSRDVFVISVGRKNLVEDIDGIKVYRIKPFNLFNFLDINKKPVWLHLPWHIIDMFNEIQCWRIYKILMKERPDVALTHNLKGLGYYTSWLLRNLKIKNIHTVHDMQLLHPSGLIKVETGHPAFAGHGVPSLPAKIYAQFCKKLFGSPAIVIFPSQYIKSIYEKYGFFPKSERVVLGNPIVISPVETGHPAFAGHGVPSLQKDGINILFLGQIEEYKGIFELINAAKKINGDLTLHIVGEGKALACVKELAAGDERIKFYGRLSHEEIEQKIWPNIDLLINPSKTPESFGLVVVEALAHGVPAIVSGLGALPELVIEGETGFIFSFSRPSGFMSLRAKRSNLINLFMRLLRPLCFARGPRNDNSTVLSGTDDLEQKIIWCIENKEKLAAMKEKCFEEAKKYDLNLYIDKLINYAKK
ncbi:glycosyltransferase [Candidatus Falkowbacteria bacterium]|nr:glycosyltransferase [Candidatus Falkowbacteria bacterium]